MNLLKKLFGIAESKPSNVPPAAESTTVPSVKTVPAALASANTTPWKHFREKHGEYIPYEPEDTMDYPCEIQTMFSDAASADRAINAVSADIAAKLRQVNVGISSSSGSPRFRVVHEGRLTGAQFKSFILCLAQNGAEVYEAFARGAPEFGKAEVSHSNKVVYATLDGSSKESIKAYIAGKAENARFTMRCPICGGKGNMSGVGGHPPSTREKLESKEGMTTSCLGCDATLTITMRQLE